MLKIYCKNTGTSKEFQEGVTLAEVLPHFDFERPYDILCAKVNFVTQGMKYRAFNNRAPSPKDTIATCRKVRRLPRKM